MRHEAAGHLRSASLPDDPVALFADWHRRAVAADEIQYPSAMCLSTVSEDLTPQGRYVIAHPQADGGFVFLTDARSPKARALAARPAAALTAYWPRPLELQVRIEGTVERTADELADAIFARRPARSRLTPWVSRQSQPVELDELTAALARLESRHAAGGAPGDGPARPEHWVAYRLAPQSFEFWAARAGRLHDRFLYNRAGGGWRRRRLAP